MLETIETRILDILAADKNLIAGGNAYVPGWSGVRRVTQGVSAAPGYVNLFDDSYEWSDATHRPAIYVGTRGLEANDKLDFPVLSGPQRIEYRIAIIPLILCTMAPTKYQARQQRNQLRNNVKQILLAHLLDRNNWYELSVPGEAGGGQAREHLWVTASGGGTPNVGGPAVNVNIAEAMCTVPVVVRYSFSLVTPA